MTEKEKMIAGKIYDPTDKELAGIRQRAHVLCCEYNKTDETETQKRDGILSELIPNKEQSGFFQGPIYFDYGINTHIGENFYANFNLTVLDCAPVKIENNDMIGPNCSIVTPVHPLLPSERNMRKRADGTPYNYEYAKPIEIGNDCWLASNVTVIGGVTIGEGCVIGAGSVVTKDIPDGSLAVGNPCRVLRKITDADKVL